MEIQPGQKHASHIISFKDRYTHAKPLMTSLNTLNIYQLNIYKILLLMNKVKNNNITHVFKQSFSIVNSKYNTKSSNLNFYKHLYKTKMHNIRSVIENHTYRIL